LRRSVAEFRFAHHHPGEEGSERKRHAEQLGRSIDDANGNRNDTKREQLAGAGWAIIQSNRGNTRRPATNISVMKAVTLASVIPSVAQTSPSLPWAVSG
jgi:hypothetical protein